MVIGILSNSPPEISGFWRLVSPLCPLAGDSLIVECQILLVQHKHVNILCLIAKA